MERFLCRAWHKAEKRMFDVEGVFPYQDEHTKGGEVFEKGKDVSYYFPEEVELMQCAGVKDKNGKLIYEGDILKFPFGNTFKNGCVSYVSTIWDVSNAQKVQGSWCGSALINCNKKSEIIGNKFENPELLKEVE